MEFMNASFDRSDEYREFILEHDTAVPTEKGAWIPVARAGKKVVPYCESMPEDEPERDPQFYLEFVDEDLNIYVDFFDRDTEQWVDSYRFKDKQFTWTICVDNWLYGNPLGFSREELPE